MEKLSVAIITHNEEDNVRTALESVKWADEIVVVDSFSTDRTIEICKEYTDRIFLSEWEGFSRQKNKVIGFTSHLWVLVIDADEYVTEELKEEIIRELGHPRYDGYYIPRKNYFGGRWIRHGGWFPDHTLRLFRKDKGLFYDREVHEAIELNGEPGYLKNSLKHYTYRNISDYLQRMDRYSTLAADEMLKKGKRFHLYNLFINPATTFLKMYIFKRGFLDGIYGLILSGLYTCYTFAKYAKLKELSHRKTP
ncbi:MAG: glycosyltransferase family 2 protein [Nitrospirota bacterium]